MNQSITNHGKVYEITGVDVTGTKFILTGAGGEQVALPIDMALLDVYTKQVTSDMDRFSNIGELMTTISAVDKYLANNGAYQRMRELVPTISLSEEMLQARIQELRNYFEKKYPNKIMIEPEQNKVEENSMNEQEEPSQNVTPENMKASVSNVEEVTETTPIFVPIRDINVMLINHDQKLIRRYLMDKYEGYEVTEDLSLVRDPRTGETYHMSLTNSGAIQMISTQRNLNQEFANTPALTDTQRENLKNKSNNELHDLLDKTTNLVEATEINRIIKERNGETNIDDTTLIDQTVTPQKNKTLVLERRNTMGFISNLAISFLVGVVGGIALMIIGNSISLLF